MPALRHWLIALVLCVPACALAQENWKINLKNADIREFITQISTITGRSFIVDPRVKGKVTVISSSSMDEDTIYELFLSVLRVHGYAAVPSGKVIKIVQQVLAKQSANNLDFTSLPDSEEIITQVLPIRNTSATELVKILRPMIPQYAQIAGLTTPNALILSDHAGNIARLVDIVRRIDVADESTMAIVKLSEAWVEDVVSLLEQLAPDQIGKGAKGPNRVTVVASERTNSLVLKGDPGTLEKMKALIKQLDVKANNSGSIQVVRLAHSDAKELADLLKGLISDSDKDKKNAPGQGVTVSIQADESLNALVIRADPLTMTELKDIIGLLDVRRLQVLIEAAIVEVKTDFTRELGSELAIGDTSSSSFPLGVTVPDGTLANLLATLAVGGTPTSLPSLGSTPLLAGGRGSNSGISFGLIIRALARNDDINLLSTPSITTMDHQPAKIVVGQNVPFRTGSTVTGSQGASNPFTTIQRQDVGLTMEVTPHIHDGHLVRLEIKQEVSEVDETSLGSIGSGGSADLITNKSTLETTVLADNGEVIVLGGLIRDKMTDFNSRVPFLGSIPIVGNLFKNTQSKREKQNLLIFLRPTVLSTREDVVAVAKRKYETGVWQVDIEGTDPVERIGKLFDGKR